MNEKELLITMLTRIGHELDIFEVGGFEEDVDDNSTSTRYVFNEKGMLIRVYSI